MYYFVSAWYPEQRTWYEDTELWYRDNLHLRYDDTINQLRMFEQAGQAASLVTLNYMPNFRYFTHRFGLLELGRWSAFDVIQDTVAVEPQMLDFRRLNWPKGAEFIYNFFAIMVQLDGLTIAKIEFGPNGQLIFIDDLDQGERVRRYVFDDRGFVSSVLYFEAGQPAYQEYFNSYGQWQIREDLRGSGEVVVNPEVAKRFKQTHYQDMEALIREVFADWVERHLAKEDCLVLAADERHNRLVTEILDGHTLVTSFFQDRMDLKDLAALRELSDASQVLLVDRLSSQTLLEQSLEREVLHLSPFDSRLSLGKSQGLKTLLVYVLLDGLSQAEREQALEASFEVMRENPAVMLSLVTYDNAQSDQLKTWLVDYLDGQSEDWLSLDERLDSQGMFELEMPGQPVVQARLSFACLESEQAIMEAMQEVRLVVDLAQEPDLYTQIAAISTGIPQVNRRQTEFVAHKQNGYLVEEFDELTQALQFYLDGLANWNQALVYSVEKISDYTSGRLVNRLVAQVDEKV